MVAVVALITCAPACSSEKSNPNVTSSPATNGATAITPVTITYGDDPSQFGQLWPARPSRDANHPVVILVHGGFWRSTYGLELMNPMAADLVTRGFTVWNIEYRRVGQTGGGYPGTLDDVSAAIDHLSNIAEAYHLDVSRLSVIGHSAGGHLALWSAGRSQAVVTPGVAIGLGAVVNLDLAATQLLGDGAAIELLGGTPSEVPDRYFAATPPSAVRGVRMVSVRASGDDVVPAEFTVPGVPHDFETVDVAGDHFTLIDPTHESWSVVVERLAR